MHYKNFLLDEPRTMDEINISTNKVSRRRFGMFTYRMLTSCRLHFLVETNRPRSSCGSRKSHDRATLGHVYVDSTWFQGKCSSVWKNTSPKSRECVKISTFVGKLSDLHSSQISQLLSISQKGWRFVFNSLTFHAYLDMSSLIDADSNYSKISWETVSSWRNIVIVKLVFCKFDSIVMTV